MKQDFTLQQYEQIAKEAFGKTMNAIPFVSDVEISGVKSSTKIGDFHATVHFTDEEAPVCFCIEVKSNGEKRYANQFIQRTATKKEGDCFVFMAPYISDESASAMREEHCSYMDLSGNCCILTRRIILYVSGQSNKFINKREKQNYLSKSAGAASAIIRTLLNAPHKKWQVKTVSQESGKAIGTASNVKRFLKDRDWIKDTENGFKLQNIKELLYAWAKEYHKKDSRTCEFYSLDTIPEIEQSISRWSISHENSAVLGGFSAAARYAPTVRYTRADVYVEPQYYDEFVKDLELQPVHSGGNVVITIPHDETPCIYAKEINGSYVTSPAQTILDLLGNTGRGEEAADAIISKEYWEDEND